MQGILDRLLKNEYILYALFAVTCIGMYYSQAVVSIATVIFLAIGLLAIMRPGALRRLSSDPWAIALMSVLLVYLASGLNSMDTARWLKRIYNNVPYLAIPLALHAFGPIRRQQYIRLLAIFIGVTTLSALVILFDYVQNFTEYNEIYKVGKTIPTPIIHVRYSYFLALACMLCAGLFLEGAITSKREKWIAVGVGVFLMVFLHVLAVRTGLLAFYGGALVLAIVMVIRERKWKVAVATVLGMILIGGIAFVSMPSLANKIGYMRHDLRVLTEQGGLPQYSDNVRITSIAYGLTLFSRHPIVGVGLGDINAEMDALYERNTPAYPADRRYLPISQYVFWLSCFGLLGTVLLLGLWLYPLKYLWRRSYLVVAIYGATLFSFLAETSIQLQLGKTLFLLLLFVIIQYWRNDVVAQSIFAPGRIDRSDLVE